MKYVKEFVNHFSNRSVFTAVDARLFLSSLGAGKRYVNVFLTNLVKSGKVTRLKKGVYSFKQDPALAVYAFSPAYHGLQDALSIHGLWEQETVPVIITPGRVRQGIRTIAGGKVLVRRISRKMFFGLESIKQGDEWIRVSDVEKTLIDLVYFRQPIASEALKEIEARLNDKKLEQYLKKSPVSVRKRVLVLLKAYALNSDRSWTGG